MQSTAIIFDMDGVLILSEQAHWQSWQIPAQSRGLPLKYETFLSCFGRINPDCINIMFGNSITPAESIRIADEKEIAFRNIVKENVPLAPGTEDLLKTLKNRGAHLAVGSSGPKENVELILTAGNIKKYFDAIVHGGEVKNGKPAPDVFLLAAQRLNIPPANCSVIEDAPAGLRAAVAAAMRPIAVATTHKPPELKTAGAIAIFPDLKSIPIDFLLKPTPPV